MSVADFIATMANVSFLVFLLIILLNIFIKNRTVQLVIAIIFTGVALFIKCYHNMTLVELVHGINGDLSISSILFLLFWAFIYFKRIPLDLFDRMFCLIIASIGLVLYLSVLDIIPLDLYRSGYLPNSILGIIFLLCMLFVLLNSLFAFIWLIAIIMFAAKLQHSVNLWDYLIDPLLWLICVYKLIFHKSASSP